MSTNCSPLEPGDVVAAAYRVGCVLGMGGTSAVVAASDVRTGEEVAIKCLLAAFSDDASLVRRFQREGNIATRLRSEHAVRVLDVGFLDHQRGQDPNGYETSTGQVIRLPYIVMERLDGCDLRALLEERRRIEPREAAGYVAQVCAALGEAHALGVIHRDIKPGNLFLTRRRDGRALIKVLDFGIAKCTSASAAGDRHVLTRAGATLGTLSYMPPEQIAASNDVDTRSDIWSLGATLYRLITGVVPFTAKTPVDLALRIVNEGAPSMERSCPGLPPGLDAVVRRCLQKRRRDRYQNVMELARALAPFSLDAASEGEEPPTVRLGGAEPTRAWGHSPNQWAAPVVSARSIAITHRMRGARG